MSAEKPPLPLSNDQIEHLVEKVTERVIENVYISIGQSVVKKFFWVIGLGALSLVTYLAGTGQLK